MISILVNFYANWIKKTISMETFKTDAEANSRPILVQGRQNKRFEQVYVIGLGYLTDNGVSHLVERHDLFTYFTTQKLFSM